MTDEITVLVVDDQEIVRRGLRMMLDAEADITVVGEAENGSEAVKQALSLLPDVVLMDVRMPGTDGIEATREIVSAGTSGAVVIITTFDDEEYLLESVRAGAFGFLLKDAGGDLLSASVRTAHRGDMMIDPGMTRALLEHRLSKSTLSNPDAKMASHQTLLSLSERERDVLGAIARGLSNAAIADEFFLSEATIKTHISNVLMKTNTNSRVQAAVFAYESGFVRPGWLDP